MKEPFRAVKMQWGWGTSGLDGQHMHTMVGCARPRYYEDCRAARANHPGRVLDLAARGHYCFETKRVCICQSLLSWGLNLLYLDIALWGSLFYTTS